MGDKRASQNRWRRELNARKKELRRHELVVNGENLPMRKRNRHLTGLARRVLTLSGSLNIDVSASDNTTSVRGEGTMDRGIDVSNEPIEGVEEIVQSAENEQYATSKVVLRTPKCTARRSTFFLGEGVIENRNFVVVILVQVRDCTGYIDATMIGETVESFLQCPAATLMDPTTSDNRSISPAVRTSTDEDYFAYIRATKRETGGVQVKYDAIFLLDSKTELDIPTYQENTSKSSFVSRKDILSWRQKKGIVTPVKRTLFSLKNSGSSENEDGINTINNIPDCLIQNRDLDGNQDILNTIRTYTTEEYFLYLKAVNNSKNNTNMRYDVIFMLDPMLDTEITANEGELSVNDIILQDKNFENSENISDFNVKDAQPRTLSHFSKEFGIKDNTDFILLPDIAKDSGYSVMANTNNGDTIVKPWTIIYQYALTITSMLTTAISISNSVGRDKDI
ncbi:Uncharacterized protein Fot_42118 [Forsythia ovata]|uniref:Uncharacterized protein n=1 Tax=Forsythia ovata TaxID=205694 RepID=A0ABD1RK98_9LAMI